MSKCFVAKTFFLQRQKWTNLITYSFFINDDCQLQEAEEVHLLLGEFPTFSVQFDEYFNNFSSSSALDPCDPKSSIRDKSRANSESTNYVDSTRFPEISSEEIEELKAVALSKNTSCSTKQWMNVFKSWCQSHPLTMVPEELDNTLNKL